MTQLQHSLHEQVAIRLRGEIFARTQGPGSLVDEPGLSDSLKISRTALREALKVLASEGLVPLEPRRGSFVREVTVQDLDGKFPVLALLQGRCAFEAARNASDADLAALDVLHVRLRKHARSRQINAYYATNLGIHEAIITLANNRWLAQVIADLRKILKLARLQQLHAPGRLAQSLDEHLSLYAALRARDSQGAEAAMRTHRTRQRDVLRELGRHRKSALLA